jgi:hypothetical protein
MSLKAFPVCNPDVGETALPYFAPETEDALGLEREPALDELHGFLNAKVTWQSQQKMQMAWHHDELMDNEPFEPHLCTQYLDQEVRHALGLKDCSASGATRGHKEYARLSRSAVRIGRPCRSGHRRG